MTIDPRIVGTWRMKSTIGRDDAGQVLPPPYGPVAMGLVVFQADGRMMAVLCDGRASLPDGEPRQFMSYAGNYTFDGTALSTRVDASSDASRVGGPGAQRTVRGRPDGAGAAAAALRRRHAAPGAGLGAHRRLSQVRFCAGTIVAACRCRLTGTANMASSTNQTSSETPVVKSTVEAREGVTGHGVRYVLMISTAAVVVIFVALWLFYFH
jgi:hypothetical protein